MEINQNMLNSLLSLSDTELQEKMRMIALALGLNPMIVTMQTSNVTKLRGTLENTSVDELNRMLGGIESTEASEILKAIEQEKNR